MPLQVRDAAPMIVAGDKWLAILTAAFVFYAIGFLIYGVVLSQLWLRLSGYSREQLKPHIWKTALSPVMPLLIATGLAMVMKWARVDSPASGVLIAGQVWLFVVAPVRLYSYVYSTEKAGLLAMDAIHLLLGCLTAGAIIGAWR